MNEILQRKLPFSLMNIKPTKLTFTLYKKRHANSGCTFQCQDNQIRGHLCGSCNKPLMIEVTKE